MARQLRSFHHCGKPLLLQCMQDAQVFGIEGRVRIIRVVTAAVMTMERTHGGGTVV